MKTLLLCSCLLAFAMPATPVPPAAPAQKSLEDRDLVGIAEEQALLTRQLRRLQQTMEVLIPRLEGEGRTHALQLLREGLTHLEDRADATGARTLEELMENARESLQDGRAVQSLEQQEAVVGSLERLLAILMDRENLESLEDSLKTVRELQEALSSLSSREAELQQLTRELREKSANESQRELEASLQTLLGQQRDLLERNEAAGRSSGAMELELFQRALNELRRQQQVDAAVLRSWDPERSPDLETAREAVEQARQAVARSERLAEAARQLREAANASRAGEPNEELQPITAGLETAAERQERHARASGDESAREAAEALRQAADSLRQAGRDAQARSQSAQSMEERAAELEAAASREASVAQDARGQGKRALDDALARGEQAGPSESEAVEALERALEAGAEAEKGAEPGGAGEAEAARAQAARATEEAGRALARAAEEQSTMGPAMAASQEAAAREAERIERGLETHPRSEDEAIERAREALQAAAQAMRSASEGARAEQAGESASAADAAESSLAEAEKALDAALSPDGSSEPSGAKPSQPREPGSSSAGSQGAEAGAEASESGGEPQGETSEQTGGTGDQQSSSQGSQSSSGQQGGQQSSPQGSQQSGSQSPSSPGEQLAQEQEQLAEATQELEPDVEDASLDEEGREEVREALDEAREAMERAANEMRQGRSASAAGSQREAISALQRASESAESGVSPTAPEDREQAARLEQEQEEIRRELLDLAVRMEERKGGRPSPGVERAAESAEAAQQALGSGELDEAEQAEEEVQRNLEEAIEDLAEEEEQYQRLRDEELLFRIAEEVEALLESHTEAMVAVREVEAERDPGERPSRPQRLRLRRLSREEAALGTRSGELAQAIEGEGSVVFARLLAEMQEDLERIARDLDEAGGYRTGSRTQTLQEDVQESGQWLLEALRQEQARRQDEQSSGEPGPQQDQGENRLVPDVAELRLLRRMEVESLDRLNRMLIFYPELQETGEDVDSLVLEEIRRLAGRHERTTELFQQFRRRLGIPSPDGQPEEGAGEAGEEDLPIEDARKEP